jgi:hypothetical protein
VTPRHGEAAADPPAPSVPGSHWADTQVMPQPPAGLLAGGPPVLMCAIRHAAEDGTGPDAAARLAATLVMIGLELTVLADTGQLPRIAEADDEMRAGLCPRCRIHRDRHTDPGHAWIPPGAAGPVGVFRRQAAALLLGHGPPPVLPGAERIPVADLYEAARPGP